MLLLLLQVVTKLFHIVEPDVACFGQKDYQQWRLITRMVGGSAHMDRAHRRSLGGILIHMCMSWDACHYAHLQHGIIVLCTCCQAFGLMPVRFLLLPVGPGPGLPHHHHRGAYSQGG
jgi:hypothetical protein